MGTYAISYSLWGAHNEASFAVSHSRDCGGTSEEYKMSRDDLRADLRADSKAKSKIDQGNTRTIIANPSCSSVED